MLGRIPLRPAAMAALLLTLSITLAVNSSGARADGDEDQAPPIPEKRELKYPNLGSHLDQLVGQVEEGEATAEEAAGEAPMHREESVAVTIYLSGHVAEVVHFLEDNGGDPRNVGKDYIEAYVPVSLLRPVSERPGVLRVREIVPPQPSQLTQQVIGNGPAVHGSLPWNQAEYNGQGVKVGVIDLGFKDISSLRGTEIPSRIVARCYTSVGVFTGNLADCEAVDDVSTFWPDWPECLGPAQLRENNSADHGTIVAESLLDMAPGVTLYIAYPRSKGDMQATVDWMASEGVQVINHSVGWTYDGPGNGTSPSSISPLNTVDRAVDGGILWVNAAGNNAEETWFGSYSDPDGNGAISFGGDAGNDEVNRLPLRACRSYRVQLRWEDSWGGANTDLDLYLYDTITGQIHPTIKGQDPQSGRSGHQPFEWISFYSRVGTNDLGLVVDHHAGPVPEWIQVVSWSIDPLERHTLNGSISNPAESANRGLLAVGAAPWFDVNTIEFFSSQGPTPDGRIKPDIVGADCGATALAPLRFSSRLGGDCGFAGTSQASPHVAGMAALVRQRYPELGPVEVAEYLKVHAIQREYPDPNTTWGHGFAALPPVVLCSNNPGLAADCDRLRAARDTLAGTGTLNWSNNVPIEDWDGVTVGDSPLRVTELRLPKKGLTGEIPAGLGSLANLEELWLSENQLTGEIPAELGNLANLSELVLWGNELSGEIPAGLGSLSNLDVLSLSGNGLTGEIPSELGNLANLEELYLSHNQLSGTIPTQLGSLANLKKLSLTQNQLNGAIPAELARLTSLDLLALGGNHLTGTIPIWLGNLTDLQELYLWGNQLAGEIPKELGNLPELTVLSLSGNDLTGAIRTDLGGLTNLERLRLSENQLTGSIPPTLGNLPKLEELYLGHNQLSGTIPAELRSLANLKELSLMRNQLSGPIPVWLGSLANLQELHLWGNELTGTIPAELGGLANLEGLGLSENQLTGEIPAELARLTSLETLNLGGNQLTGTIPVRLGSLANLQELHLWDNQLNGEIPPELGSLANLKELSLGDNQLSGGIPAELARLTRLETLALGGNELTGTIPVWLGSLATLEELSLGDNQLTGMIPPELGSLANLEALLLNNNQLTGEIPSDLGRLTNLTVLQFVWKPADRVCAVQLARCG